jgi:hypothetical protein
MKFLDNCAIHTVEEAEIVANLHVFLIPIGIGS